MVARAAFLVDLDEGEVVRQRDFQFRGLICGISSSFTDATIMTRPNRSKGLASFCRSLFGTLGNFFEAR